MHRAPRWDFERPSRVRVSALKFKIFGSRCPVCKRKLPDHKHTCYYFQKLIRVDG